MVAKQPGRDGKHRKTLILSAAAIVLVLIFLIFDWLNAPPGSACDNVFQQTNLQLGVRLKHLDSEGSLALGRQKVQELTEQAQLMALSLKTCCIVLDAGKLNSEQFLQCKNTAGAYESKLDSVIEQVSQLSEAKQTGNTEIADQRKRELDTLLGEANELTNKLQRQVEELPRHPLELRSDNIYFEERFDGEALPPAWQLNTPDPLRWKYQVDTNTLLIVTQKGSVRGADQSLKNQFVLNKVIPEDNVEVIVKASIQIQGQQNSLSFVLWEDDDNYLEIGFKGFKHGYNVRRSPFFTKELQGQRNKIEAATKGHGGVQAPEIVYLKIDRRGNKYSGYYAYGNDSVETTLDTLEWVEIGTHAWIDFKGRPALWADNGTGTHYGSGASPEVPAEFDYVLIRKL